MLRGQTQSGFKFEIEDDVLNDWEFLELIDELEEKPNAIVRLAKRLLGKKQYDALKKHCTVNGKVVMSTMMNEVTEILNTNQETKNL
jgi:hypothetical protein